CGADDFNSSDGTHEITTAPDDFSAVRDAMESRGYAYISAEVEMIPQNYITLTDPDDIKKMDKLLEMLEDNDDVQNVWHNYEPASNPS
ncbi:MAG: YebC/PmpR family DNA-binding transcriptional regulator, partial [Oscillospiraceae bacterium]|nr:YebC/PmpR family DNA-binding transcriptional regulator [Oscillospiraceae bacterium]